MDFLINIFEQLVPFFRVGWIISIFIGIALLVLAFVLKKNPERKKSPWIAGSIGLLAVVSSGTQLVFSLI